ncbi:MAG: DUF4238 domain-containing protein [Succinimonas sp.]|nr:DUF4238 domain-containing protein [Succinimonas sp.]
MVNSHYVPRLILRKFADDNEHLIYADLVRRKCEDRNLKSIFSEIGYYSDEIEHELTMSVEDKFAKLFNDNLLKSGNQIILSREDLFLIKKFLLIASLRKRINLDEVDTRNGALMDEIYCNNHAKNFESRMDAILKCNSSEALLKFCDDMCENSVDNTMLRAIKRIVCGYMSFVSSDICGENFIISDCACGYWYGDGPFGKMNLIFGSDNPIVLNLLNKWDPADYVYFPLSKLLGVLVISPVFRKEYGLFDAGKYSRSNMKKRFGFDDKKILSTPVVANLNGNNPSQRKYIYTKTQLSSQNAIFFNNLIMQTSSKFIGFSDFEKIKRSLDSYLTMNGSHDLTFIAEFFKK